MPTSRTRSPIRATSSGGASWPSWSRCGPTAAAAAANARVGRGGGRAGATRVGGGIPPARGRARGRGALPRAARPGRARSSDELRRRVGSVFTLAELAAEYRRADDWVPQALAELPPEARYPPGPASRPTQRSTSTRAARETTSPEHRTDTDTATRRERRPPQAGAPPARAGRGDRARRRLRRGPRARPGAGRQPVVRRTHRRSCER